MVPTPAAALGVVIPYNSAWSLAWTTSYNSAGSLVWHVCETRVCLAWSGRPRRCWGWLYPIRLRQAEQGRADAQKQLNNRLSLSDQ